MPACVGQSLRGFDRALVVDFSKQAIVMLDEYGSSIDDLESSTAPRAFDLIGIQIGR